MTQREGSSLGDPANLGPGSTLPQLCPKLPPIGTCHLPLESLSRGEETELLLSKMWNVRKSALHPGPSISRRFGWTQANLCFGALCISALQSKVTLISVVCICTGKAKYFYYLFYYLLYELLLFTWRFCLLLQVWNYLLLLGICALFKKQALFFFNYG